MTHLDELFEEPWRFDFFALMRRIERHHASQPRIGHSATLDQDIVRLGQDPFMAFPASNVSRADRDSHGRLRVFTRFLGMLGPQGALPIATTEETWRWNRAGDEGFSRFLDIFEHRFLQLFFRAWADARPVSHHDRPQDDRFIHYLGSAIGLATPPYRDLDRVPDLAKLGYAGLMAPKVKSATRLEALISGLFRLKVEVEQFVGMWLSCEPEERSRLGQAQAVLGQSLVVGASVYSVEDKISIRLYAADLDQYRDFLPSGDLCALLTDAVFFYLGPEIDWDVEIALPAAKLRPTRLGTFGQLGWTSWLAPEIDPADRAYRCDAHFHPMSRRYPPKAAEPTPPAGAKTPARPKSQPAKG